MTILKTGKLDSDLLQNIVLDEIRLKRPEILTRAAIGEDCAVVDFGGYECVTSTDPITADVKDIGRLAIHISCNDIASNGVEPLAILLTVLLPEGTTDEEVALMMKQAARAADQVGVEIAGGHTEVTPAVRQPVIVSTAFGRGPKGASASARDMRPGDRFLLSKAAGLEGTGILASDGEGVLSRILTEEELAEAQSFLDQISVVREGVLAAGIGTSGMHDVTEGGVFGAIWEVCQVSGLGARIEETVVPVHPVTRKICDYLGADWRRMISSGAMLITASPDKAEAIIEACGQAGVPVADIGEVRPAEEGVLVNRSSSTGAEGAESEDDLVPIAPPRRDELYTALEALGDLAEDR